MMALEEILLKHRETILRKWFSLIAETYPSDTRKFLHNQVDRFANPMRATIVEGLEPLFDAVAAGRDLETEEVIRVLDKIIRMRAVQDFSASEAMEFVFLLKDATREVVVKQVREPQILDELLAFESRIDRLALLSFTMYMQCREKLYDLKANELRKRTNRVLERACRIWEARGEPLPDELKS